MRRQRNLFQVKEKINPQKNPKEMEITDLSDKEFKIIVMKVLAEVRRTMHEQVRISTEMENIRKH